ncbi:MAG: ABC transporter permease [bacterium]|nr:ABC transporter permease [bacterium]
MVSDVGNRRRPVVFTGIVTLVFLFILSPLIFITLVSLFSNQIMAFPPEGWSFRWYQNIWQQAAFVDGFVLSVQVALLSMAAGVILGSAASVAIVRYDFPGRNLLSMLLLSPLIVPGIVAGTALYIFFVDLTQIFGLRLAATLPGLVLAHVTITIPWTVRLISASLVGVDRSVEEAAMNLGANHLATFWRVTLPMIRPGIVAAALFSFIVSYGNLEMSLFLVGPGHTTLPIAILQYLNFNLDPTVAAVSVLQIVIIGVAMLMTNRFVKLSAIV